MNTVRLPLTLIALLLFATPAGAQLVNYEMVTVGDPGNEADDTGYGAVDAEFRIGKYEVTIGQYTEFLNAVARSDPHFLWNGSQASDISIAGISRSGAGGSYEYSLIGPFGTTPAGANDPGNRPVAYISWFDAARFANWMHNGQLTGAAGAASTETGAYTLDGATSGDAPPVNPGALFYIPTENQWYKAAYYKGGSTNAGYWNYATQSDTTPGNTIGGGANQANFFNGVYSVTQSSTGQFESQNYLTNRGAFTSNQSAYGTFDQSGNLWEWNDLTGVEDNRGFRGGSWYDGESGLASSARFGDYEPGLKNFNNGFRLAAPVPEPSTYAMALAGLACGGYLVRRRRRRA